MSYINHHRAIIATMLFAPMVFEDYAFARKKLNPLSFEHQFHKLIITTANKYIDAFREFDSEIMMSVLLKHNAMDEQEWLNIITCVPLVRPLFETYTKMITNNAKAIKDI